MSELEPGARVRLIVDYPLLGKWRPGTVEALEPDGLVRVVFDVWDVANATYRPGTHPDLVSPAELEPLRPSSVRYDIPLSELNVGDSVGLASGSIFWRIETLDRRERVAVAHNGLGGSSARRRTFRDVAPVAIIRHAH